MGHPALDREGKLRVPRLRSEPVAFLSSFKFWWPESSEEHRPIIILGVLRLRARNPLLSSRSARRFAQDDGLVGVLKNILVECAKKHKNQKVTASRDDKVEGRDVPLRPVCWMDRSSTRLSPSISQTDKVSRYPHLCHPERSRGTCSSAGAQIKAGCLSGIPQLDA